jgi:hypothetical protein
LFIVLLALVVGAFSQIGCAKEDNEDLFNKKSQGAAGGKSDSPNSAASCANSCEGSSEDGSCWCDPGCDLIGDCCADYQTSCANTQTSSGGGGGASGGSGGAATGGAGGTKPATGGTGGIGGVGGAGYGGAGFGGTTGTTGQCAGYCGGQSPAGCYCDAQCTATGDCCPDVAMTCGGGGVGGATGTGGGCTPQLCASGQPAIQNGIECYCDPYCMDYGDCCSNKPQICGF